MAKDDFLETYRETMGVGFWTEAYKRQLATAYECMHKPEIIKDWGISDIVLIPNSDEKTNDKVLIKWYKRIIPLTTDELKERFPYLKK